jgi:ribosomal protein L32
VPQIKTDARCSHLFGSHSGQVLVRHQKANAVSHKVEVNNRREMPKAVKAACSDSGLWTQAIRLGLLEKNIHPPRSHYFIKHSQKRTAHTAHTAPQQQNGKSSMGVLRRPHAASKDQGIYDPCTNPRLLLVTCSTRAGSRESILLLVKLSPERGV